MCPSFDHGSADNNNQRSRGKNLWGVGAHHLSYHYADSTGPPECMSIKALRDFSSNRDK